MDAFRKMSKAVRSVVPGLSGLTPAAVDSSEGERLLEQGRFAEAEEFFLCLLDQTRDRAHRRFVYAKTLSALANARYQQKKYAQARETALAALIHLDAEKQNTEVAETEDLLASICLKLSETLLAVPHLERALATQLKARPIDYRAIIERHWRLAAVLDQVEETERAIEELSNACNLASRECGPEHQLTGDCEAQLGRMLREAGRFEEAAECLRKALAAHMVSPGEDSEEVAKDYQALAETYQAADDLEQAVTHYEKALRLRERQLGGGNSGDYASVLMGLGGTHSLRGNYGTAIELMQQAVGRYEGARDERLAPALESLGVVYVVSGRTQEAITTLRKARGIWESDPERHASHLQANSQLFETVASYLTPTAGNALIASVQGAAAPVSEPVEMKPEVKAPAVHKPRRTDAVLSLPSGLAVELETWADLETKRAMPPPPRPAPAPPPVEQPRPADPQPQHGAGYGPGMPGAMPPPPLYAAPMNTAMPASQGIHSGPVIPASQTFVSGHAFVPGQGIPAGYQTPAWWPQGEPNLGVGTRGFGMSPVLGPLSSEGGALTVTGNPLEGGMYVPASMFPALWEAAAAAEEEATAIRPAGGAKRQQALSGWEELDFDYLTVTNTR